LANSKWLYAPESLLGPLSFLVMIDDLNGSGCDIYKYVDDNTITEIGHSSSTSRMHEYLDNLLLWTQENDMKINISKTKELLIGPCR